MSVINFRFPSWIALPRAGDDPRKDAGRERTRFLLRVAALHMTREGTLSAMSEQLGLARSTIGNYCARGDAVTVDLAREIERKTNGVCRAFYFRPDAIPPAERNV